MKLFFGLTLQIICCCCISAQITFTEQAKDSGIDHSKSIRSIGNGTSFVDFDGDGWDDITLGTEAGVPIAFYKNVEGTFQKLPPLVDHTEAVKQILWVDYDNDGDKDLFVATFGGVNRLYNQKGPLEFEDVTFATGLPNDVEYTYGACWADYNRDGWLDLYFGYREDLVPDKYNRLFKNNGQGKFIEVGPQTNTTDFGKLPFCSAFFDCNNDNWPDIYTANDKLTTNTLLINESGYFYDAGAAANANIRLNAMCVAIGDYDNNGLQDIYVSNTPSGNALLQNNGIGNEFGLTFFEEVAETSGVGFYGNGWGANFFDADNDGFLDLYASGTKTISENNNRTSLFYHNQGNGTFSVLEAGMYADTTISYSNSIGDYNNDGFPDIIVQNDPPHPYHLWQNNYSDNQWIKIKLQGVKSNRDAIGARIECYSNGQFQMRYKHCGIGFLGQNTEIEIFGLGKTELVDSITVLWPTGHRDKLVNQASQQIITLVEGSTTNGQIDVDPEIDLVISSTSSINPSSVQVSPVPTNDFIIVESDLFQPKQFSLYNLNGQMLKAGRFTENENIISLDHINATVIFLKLMDDSGQSITKKVIRY